MKVEVEAKIKLKLDDRKIELTSEEARELMVQLNQLFGNGNPSPPISVPTFWPDSVTPVTEIPTNPLEQVRYSNDLVARWIT